MLNKVISFLANPLADIVGGWQGRKTIAAETAAKQAESDMQMKLAINQAKIDRIKSQDNADAAYDLMVLENRKSSLLDEVLIIFWLVVFAMHFLPSTAPLMADGWKSIAKAPWWFQFGMLGILVSTLGLMRLFRMWTEKKFTMRGRNE